MTEHLPRSGLLLFFYDAEQAAWGSDPDDKGSWAVVFREEVPADAPEVGVPGDLPATARYRGSPAAAFGGGDRAGSGVFG